MNLQPESAIDIEEAERIVKAVYPAAFPFIDAFGGWSICDGTRTKHGNIRIKGCGWHTRIEDAWIAAAEFCKNKETT